MAARRFNCLADLQAGSYNWEINVRIIRTWRGEGAKGLNMVLLDEQNSTIHAFAPASVIDKHESLLLEGNVCYISNFGIKNYKNTEKFRPVNHECQIVFTTYTEVTKAEKDDGMIARYMFDFYDLSSLDNIANDNTYLTDVIGIIETDTPLADITNKFGKPRKQLKFTIVDGRTNVSVCFWDSFAEDFELALEEVEEYPTIIIIASAKITSWQRPRQSAKQYEVSNATATKFYLNITHPNVALLRSMLKRPEFTRYKFASHVKKLLENFSLSQIKELSMDYAEKEVVCQVKITTVIETKNWYEFFCTSCYKVIEMSGRSFNCYRSTNRHVPQPAVQWHVIVLAEDETDVMNIALLDREVRTLVGLQAANLEEEISDPNVFPSFLKTIENKTYLIKLQIKESNISKHLNTYYATGIYEKQNLNVSQGSELATPSSLTQYTMTQASGSACNLDDFSDLNFLSTGNEEKKKKKKRILVKKSH